MARIRLNNEYRNKIANRIKITLATRRYTRKKKVR